MAWAGYEFPHRTYQLGITERRASWFVRWTQDDGDVGAVSPELREVIVPSERNWAILPDALKMGRCAEFLAFKRSGFDPKRCERRLKRKKPTERLRLTDPW